MVFPTISNVFRLRRYIHEELERRKFVHENYRELQSERLTILVKHAYDNVDLYRNKYDEVGVKPGEIKSVEDIHKLPLVTKDDLRGNFPTGILAQNIDPKDCQLVGTSGSTGVPIKIYKDRESMNFAIFRALSAPEKLATEGIKGIKRRVMAIFEVSEGGIENLFRQQVLKLPRFLTKSFHFVNALEHPREHLRALEKHQPDILITYPSVLKNMAIVSQEEGRTVPQPKILATTAEVMDEHTRRVISNTFNGDVMNLYWTTEAGMIAMECLKHEGLHILCGRVVLEILRDGKPAPPGVPGDVVVTDLMNLSTPIIRYSGLGDIAVLSDGECSCGNKFPLLTAIEGRIVDSLILPSKRVVHPFSLTLALEHVPQIAKFQIIQEKIDEVRILIVAEKSRPEEDPLPFNQGKPLWSMIMDNFRELLGKDVHIAIEPVADIPILPGTGARGTVRSLVER